jgi:hypothetical protein
VLFNDDSGTPIFTEDAMQVYAGGFVI